MAIQVACAKGCGESITVTDELLSEAQRTGTPISVSHEVCPRDRVVKPEYTVVMTVYRQDYAQDGSGDKDGERVKLFENSADTHASTFKEAFPKLSQRLNDVWSEANKWADVTEQGV